MLAPAFGQSADRAALSYRCRAERLREPRPRVRLHDVALPVFERVMTRNVEREHFLQRPAAPSPGNLRDPVAKWTGVSGGWKDGDVSPHGSGPSPAAMRSAAGAAAR
jgi:hypothetical protein